MAFDQPTRNRLARFVSDARRILTDEFTRQFKQEYGIDPGSGEVSDIARLTHLNDTQRASARILRETIDHYVASSPSGGKQSAIERIVREQAFTVLNRLCALRMAEARDILIESVGKGLQSKGFQLYSRVAGTALGETGDAYRCFLFSVFDEIATDLPSLFDRFSAQGRLFPSEGALLQALDEINHPDIVPLWAEDETIGWIYQYFNSKDERKAMRDASAAPRDSRELAVRNQFFTPRYVVEFLTDNTLGRIWYEMTQGQTGLKASCLYLIRRPTEVFLTPGQEVSKQDEPAKVLSQEELLKEPIHIPHRPLKDPRDIKMLDPACGSMHFGLYAFDLFERIYDEAWNLETERGVDALVRSNGLKPLHESYSDKSAFLRDVPRLIIERNIHGIDIDPRAVQIAGLSLWLRAQKSWHAQGTKPLERPTIQRSNIVCAEPMPGEAAFLTEFLEKHLSDSPERKLLGELVLRVFENMRFAGEAGALLKIEEDIAAAVAEAKKVWLAGPTQEQQRLFAGDSTSPTQLRMRFDVAGITDATFWEKAEERIYAALRAYAESAEHGTGFQRRLFAEDAARGFAFIDVCRKRYDVTLMNPPFGDFVPATLHYMEASYPQTSIDFFASFVERGLQRLSSGLLGAITPRAFLFTKTLETWRRSRVLNSLSLLLDMGFGVLDGSMVETSGYVLNSISLDRDATVIDLRSAAPRYNEALDRVRESEWSFQCVRVKTVRFKDAPRARFLYYLGESFFALLQSTHRFDPNGGTAKNGLQTYGDERFLRLIWEVSSQAIGRRFTWLPIAKGGDYETFFFPVHLLMNYASDGLECGEVNKQDNGQTAQTKRSSKYYYRPAATYPAKSTRGFSVRQLPSDALFALKGPAILPANESLLYYVVGWANSHLVRGLVMSQASTGEYLAGNIQNLPWIDPSDGVRRVIETHTKAIIHAKQRIYALFETDCYFTVPWLGKPQKTLRLIASEMSVEVEETNKRVNEMVGALSDSVSSLYNVPRSDTAEWGIEEDDHNLQLAAQEWEESASTRRMMSYAVGIIFGRWDIRYATGEKATPDLPDPVAPMPVCPPGQLQNAHGLPARLEDLPHTYPVRIPWEGILVDDPNHPQDVERRVREVLENIWGDFAGAMEQAACQTLGVRSIREYFQKPASFFADHVQRYSKSRRQAPIYWPLSTASGSYTLWIYYHRFTDQTLFTAVNDFVEPKLAAASAEASRLRVKSNRSSFDETALEQLSTLELELHGFCDELLRLARSWKPNLNDGVQITAAPLWKLFQHKPWQKKLKETWGALEAGEYDWAHLAYSIWPDRVREKCKTDKSLAIAHGLEELFQEPPVTQKQRRRKARAEEEQFIEEAE